MRCQWLLLSLIAGLSLGWSALRAADPPPTQEQIEQLVKQLGSAKFAERDKAKRELETIGAPALAALKKAARGEDAEVSRRATDLLRTLEEKLTTAAYLAPKKVHLKLNNRPVTEAIEELSKQSGYPIEIQGDRAVLAERKITLDTGEVSFWQAVDQLCAKGQLTEIMPYNPYREFEPGFGKKGKKGFKGGLQIQPLRLQIERLNPKGIDALPILPVVPAPANPDIKRQEINVVPFDLFFEQLLPMPQEQPAIDELIKQLQGGRNNKEVDELLRRLLELQQQQLQRQLKLLPGAGVAGKPGLAGAGGVGGQPGQPGAIGGHPGQPGQPGKPGEIPFDPKTGNPLPLPVNVPTGALTPLIMQDGKPASYPTHYAGSVRVRAIPASKARDVGIAPQQEGEILVVLEVTPEPRLQGFQLTGAPRIDKAIDDREQFLFPNSDEPANATGARNTYYYGQGPQKYVALRFKADKKVSNELRELAGAVTAQVSGETTDLLSLDNVLKAEGQTVKHPEGGTLKLLSMEKVGDVYLARIRIEGLQDPNLAGVNANIRGNGVITINGRVVGGGNTSAPQLPTLVDAKNRPYQYLGNSSSSSSLINGAYSQTYTMNFRAEDGQGEPARLIITGSRTITLQIPFALENVAVEK